MPRRLRVDAAVLVLGETLWPPGDADGPSTGREEDVMNKPATEWDGAAVRAWL